MYRGFELKGLNKKKFSERYNEYYEVGSHYNDVNVNQMITSVKEYTKTNDILDGDQLQKKWFPKVKADIFLSHSHKDEDLIKAFAGYLKTRFQLDVFIDSCIWGSISELQKTLDEKYSYNSNTKLYSYNSILEISCHVHLMLNNALMQMIDECECFMFINTFNSVNRSTFSDRVISPWLYTEIGMTKLVREKNLHLHRTEVMTESFDTFSVKPLIEYNLNTKHLTELTTDDINNWQYAYNKARGLRFGNALDYLYKLIPVL